MKKIVVFSALFFFNACAARAPADPPLPKFVTIEFLGATIAPTKADHERWDGPPIGPEQVAWLNSFIPEKYESAKVSLQWAATANAAFAPPDPKGFVSVANEVRTLPKVANTFTPTWKEVAFQHVPLNPNSRLSVHLVDEDLEFDDAIGDVTVSENDLIAALRSGQIFPVNVQSQFKQILFVQIYVHGEN